MDVSAHNKVEDMANDEKKVTTYIGSELVPQQSIAQGSIITADHLYRRLNNRQIQLIAIGECIPLETDHFH